MPYSPLDLVTPEVRARAARVRLVCFDVDGTLTDGRLYFDTAGNEAKAFHVQDGQGLNLLRRFGFGVHMITARASKAAEKRGADLGIEVHIGIKDKLALVRALCEEHGLALEQVAFVGDDLPDLDCLRAAGLSVAPANAHPWIAEIVHWRTLARGGKGAAREVCDLLLAAQGHVEEILRKRAP
ncbi:MAG: HAD hydrolase family protein [Xanthomonadaceae bacterium]|jgi:3-deoxy-D-manno-octulosonate 8-phosphate phosphatase (KDO 8-P phosphatase)|nr:HAD hydrolase family protein [Xanthomonadaceae bacterium]